MALKQSMALSNQHHLVPRIHHADARDLAFLAATSIDLIVTSPPYWRRRDYGHPDQLGQEATPGPRRCDLFRSLCVGL
ncbi:MAG: hypothetical protein EOM24_08870 [Chloroflexia bacterium]|nr:hypothetical protein [Chloroflexia bacterium]